MLECEAHGAQKKGLGFDKLARRLQLNELQAGEWDEEGEML